MSRDVARVVSDVSVLCPCAVNTFDNSAESVGSSTPRTARLRQERLRLRLVVHSQRPAGDLPDQLLAVLERDRRAGVRCDAVAVADSADKHGLRRLRLRYPAVCATCGIALSKGSEALWDRATKQAICLGCAPDGKQPTAGAAGASAAAEGERRKEKRVEDVRRRYGDHAAAVAEEMAGRDAAATWGKGSEGESRIAAFVAREVGDAVIPLHDRLIPGTRGNIDHIFVASTGVWVVDPKAYTGKVEKREVGPIWRRESEVYVGGRNRTALAKGVEKQVAAVVAALKADPTLRGTDVHAALCFLDSEWGLLDFPFQIGNVWVLYPGALRKRLKKGGPLSREPMERIARRLDLSLPPAADK